MSDRLEDFGSWLHPDAHAHPASPAGGGGPGSSRAPGAYDHAAPFSGNIASPAGRVMPLEPQRRLIVADLSAAEKLKMAMARAIPLMPAKIRDKVKAMLTPEALAQLTVIAALLVASQWFGIGEVVDVLLAGWAIWTLGPEAIDAAKDLYHFASVGYHAKNDQDIDRAARAFADAITIIGVDGLAALLAHKAFKAVRETGRGAGGGSTASPPDSAPPEFDSDSGARSKRGSGRDGATADSKLAGIDANGIKAQRIRPGTSGNVAVIGQDMTSVRAYAAELEQNGYNVKTFDGPAISDGAMQEWRAATQGGKWLTPDEVAQTKLYQENQAWAKGIAGSGDTVVDIGNPANKGASAFYSMEGNTIFGGPNQ